MQMERFTATVKDQSGACFDVVFEPAPADERPQGETDGCSHYVGKAGSLKAVPSALTVTAQMTLNGAPVTAVWSPFDPVKYAHHVE